MYSVIVPVYNEKESLEELGKELCEALAAKLEGFEIIFVNDGSSDGTDIALESMTSADQHIKCIHLRRNFGKSAAYAAGFRIAKGDVLITIDGDLQDDPAELNTLLEALDEGNDLVIGVKRNRFENEPWRKIPSLFFNLLLWLAFGLKLKDSNSGFRVMRREVARGLRLYGGHYRFIPQLAYLQGFAIAERSVNHRKRKYGCSKYGLLRFWGGLVDIAAVRFITAFRQRPLLFFGTIGCLLMILGVALEIYVFVQKFLGDTFQKHLAALISGVFLILAGLQVGIVGLVGELLSARNPESFYRIDRKRLKIGNLKCQRQACSTPASLDNKGNE